MIVIDEVLQDFIPKQEHHWKVRIGERWLEPEDEPLDMWETLHPISFDIYN